MNVGPAIGLGLAIDGCSGIKVEGECSYVGEVKATYQCEAGKVEHYPIEPTQQ